MKRRKKTLRNAVIHTTVPITLKNIPKSNIYHNDVGYRMYIARMNNRARCDNKLSIIFYREKDTMLYLSDYAYVQFWDLDEFSECRMDYHIDRSKGLSWYR